MLRSATLSDAHLLAYQRRAMFTEMGLLTEADGPAFDRAMVDYISRAMPAGTFYAWLIESDGRAVAGGGLQLRTLMPRPGFVDGEVEGLIVSMWTEPEYRRRGLGRRIVEAILGWCDAHSLRRVTLHASNDGRPLYELYGFRGTNEMRLECRPGDSLLAP